MAEPIFFAPLRVPLVDPRTGLMNREWYLFFQALWMRTGGAIAPGVDDLLQNAAEGINTADVMALTLGGLQDLAQSPLVRPAEDPVEQLFVVISGLQDQIAELSKEIQALKQGPTL